MCARRIQCVGERCAVCDRRVCWPVWRNGIRDGLKNHCPYGLVGSSPTTGTPDFLRLHAAHHFTVPLRLLCAFQRNVQLNPKINDHPYTSPANHSPPTTQNHPADDCGSILLHVRHHMRVDVECHRHRRVSQHLAHHLRIDIRRKQQRGAGMAQLVEANLLVGWQP
jgi:hypothetical protein